jgi:hypothetical protein
LTTLFVRWHPSLGRPFRRGKFSVTDKSLQKKDKMTICQFWPAREQEVWQSFIFLKKDFADALLTAG